MGRHSRRAGRVWPALLLAAALPGQWPGLPERPGGQGAAEPGSPSRIPGQPPRGAFGALPQVPLPGEGPQGTAPRTGTGLGLWGALIAMAQEEPGGGPDPALEARPDRALMLRYTDEVAIRAAAEKGWDILPWWRKVHLLAAGHCLRLKGRGRALLAFHDGAALEMRGDGFLEILALDRDGVRLRLEGAKALTLDARERPFQVELPGAYLLAAAGGLVQVRLERPGRFRVDNLGPSPAVVQDRGRELRLEWNQGCSLPCFSGAPPGGLRDPGPGEAASLGEGLWRLSWQGAVRPETVGNGWRLEAGPEAVRLQWGQAGFDVPSGARLRLVGPVSPGRVGAGG